MLRSHGPHPYGRQCASWGVALKVGQKAAIMPKVKYTEQHNRDNTKLREHYSEKERNVKTESMGSTYVSRVDRKGKDKRPEIVLTFMIRRVIRSLSSVLL